MVVAGIAAAGKLSADTQLLGGPACHKQSTHWYSSSTDMGTSFGRWGPLDSPNHPVLNPSNTATPAAAWVPAMLAESILHEQPQRHQYTFAILLADLGLCPLSLCLDCSWVDCSCDLLM